MGDKPLIRMLTVMNKFGLHARPAALFVETSNRFESEILVTHNHRQVNGKAILDIMTLGAPQGAELTLTISGPDAQAAADSLEALVKDRFGEEDEV